MAKTNATENVPVRISPALIVTTVIVLSLILAAVMLYPVAREYYLAKRENDRVLLEYQAVLERNTKIKQQIDELQTPEGIEDRAREEFGWVRNGEEAVNVTGLEVSESSTVLPPSVDFATIKAPEDWWTQVLDEFFGVPEASSAR
ncbi:MAG: septum formation initiator family protein, partial [Coriobacteriales bacterium]|nr:septum formation initiator family protein [Coriobacteriales bacterium]